MNEIAQQAGQIAAMEVEVRLVKETEKLASRISNLTTQIDLLAQKVSSMNEGGCDYGKKKTSRLAVIWPVVYVTLGAAIATGHVMRILDAVLHALHL